MIHLIGAEMKKRMEITKMTEKRHEYAPDMTMILCSEEILDLLQ